MIELNELRVPELKQMCKNLGIKNYSKLRKKELIDLIFKNKSPKRRSPSPKSRSRSRSRTPKRRQTPEARPSPKRQSPKRRQTPEARKRQGSLFKGDTVFQFYSKSINKPLPGKGAGEKIGSEGVEAYDELSKIPDWRKKLSNFWAQEFSLDGKKWLSVEHYYQGSKFKKNNPEFYNKFSLDSGTELSKSPLMAKGAGGKTGKSRGKQIRPANVVLDEDFFGHNGRGEIEMEKAMKAKFTQNSDLKKLLRLTKKAKLQHFSRGIPPIVFYDLMRVRQNL